MRVGNGSQSPAQYTGPARSPGSKGSRFKVSNGDSHVKQETNGVHKGSPVATSAPQPAAYHGHDRGELTRILIQSLKDLGYQGAAGALTKESGLELENHTTAIFRQAVLQGRWAEANKLLFGSENGEGTGMDMEGVREQPGAKSTRSRPASRHSAGFALAKGANPREMLFWIRRQKYLELLERRELSQALAVLQNEITPLQPSADELGILSSLMMCQSAEAVKMRAKWDGAGGSSRAQLLSLLSQSISPSVMIPEHRLATLLNEIKQTWIDECRYHNVSGSPSLFYDHRCDRSGFPSMPYLQLSHHKDEVWCLRFSNDGTKLASSSKDKTVVIYDTERNYKPRFQLQDHTSGVAHVAWSSDDSRLITCGGGPGAAPHDFCAKIWDMTTGKCTATIGHDFTYACTAAAFTKDGKHVVIGSHDSKHGLELWDLNGSPRHQFAMDKENLRVHDLAISRDGQRLVVLCDKRIIVFNMENYDRVFDKMYDRIGDLDQQPVKDFTSVSISEDSRHMLIGVNEDRIVLAETDTGKVLRTFRGHKQCEVIIRSSFGGADESFVVSGSENSKIYIWRTNGTLVEALDGGTDGCVNAIAWHPKEPSVFASGGDDGKVRIWKPAPTHEFGSTTTNGF